MCVCVRACVDQWYLCMYTFCCIENFTTVLENKLRISGKCVYVLLMYNVVSTVPTLLPQRFEYHVATQQWSLAIHCSRVVSARSARYVCMYLLIILLLNLFNWGKTDQQFSSWCNHSGIVTFLKVYNSTLQHLLCVVLIW